MRTGRSDGDDFADWYRALHPQVLRAVTIAVGERELAEDATAEAFAKAFAQWPKPTKLDSPAAWLHTVALNVARSRWRRLRTERRTRDRMAAEPHGYFATPECRDDALWAAVAALSERARHMVALRYILDLPEAEIAAIMGVTRGTVAATLSKARRQLSAVLSRSTAACEE